MNVQLFLTLLLIILGTMGLGIALMELKPKSRRKLK
jgi:uncharacterized membrane protein